MINLSSEKRLKSNGVFGPLDRLIRAALLKRLRGIERGRVVVVDTLGPAIFGAERDLSAKLSIQHEEFYRDAAFGGTLGIAEAYVKGAWDCDDLTSLFRILLRNRTALTRIDGLTSWFARFGHRLYHAWQRNTRQGSRRNIARHYDLGNDFYRLWLDDTMAYSSGIFPSRLATMKDASIEKFDRICRKLDLQPNDKVVEIGTGWGGFAMHAAQRYGSHVTSATISQEQFEWASQRVAEAGLNDRIALLKQDYRDLRGRFDKLVSIEMIEAVGHQHLDTYFRQCSQLLRRDGTMVLQAIVMPDQHHRRYLKSVDFIQRYIFPGGCLPSLGSILASVSRVTEMRLVHLEDFSAHYAETLRRWRRSFESQLESVRDLGYDETFIRLWRYYLSYCEAAFEERHVGVVQIQFDQPACRRPFGTQAPERLNGVFGGSRVNGSTDRLDTRLAPLAQFSGDLR